jgi:hypothetical protein
MRRFGAPTSGRLEPACSIRAEKARGTERAEGPLNIMNSILSVLMITAPLVGACAATLPPPTQRLADAQSSERSAREVGADKVPAAQLSLKLANDQIAQAQKAMADGDNVRADMLLVRAKADSELALAQARENGAVAEHKEAIADSAEQKTTNAVQGAVK